MAQVTYTGQLIYPTLETLSNFSYNFTCSTAFNNDSAPRTIEQYLDVFKVLVEENFSGALSYVVTIQGSNTVVDLTWIGETPDCFIMSFGVDAASSVAYYVPFSKLATTPTILTDSCTDCFEVEANECSQIGLNLGLVEGEDYTINITDKFGKMYSLTATADEDGIIYIDSDVLPIYLLNPYAGSFIIEVYLNDSLQQFVINNHLFGCFTLNIIAGSGLSNLVPNIQATLASDLDIEVLGNE